MKTSRHFLAISIPVLALVYPLSSSAQLEEVIVTATKIETSIQDTPIAVTAFTQDQLDSQLINDTMNLQFSVPNMTMTKPTSQRVIFVFEVLARAIGSAGDPGVGVHVNGIYQTGSRIFEAQFYDTERVEVRTQPGDSIRPPTRAA